MSKVTKTESAIFEEVDTMFAELELDLGDLGLDDEGDDPASSELAELDEALAGTEFDEGGEEFDAGPGMSSILEMADAQGGDGEEFIGGLVGGAVRKIIRRRAKKLIKRITRLVRKYAKYRKCLPAVLQAVAAFKAGKYGTALKRGYSAYKCIRRHS